jgi:hypothetical protein
VNLPSPHPGLIIRYSYLWKREADRGHEEGSKDRPCAIILAIADEDDEQRILVLPITHSAPDIPADAVEIPAETKTRLRLDSENSWVVVTEANEFVWPGPDLRPIPGETTVVYGTLPPRFFAHVRDRFLERDRRKKTHRVKRTE